MIMLNNIGLSLVNVFFHLMLKASSTAWVILFTWLLLPEKPTVQAIIVALISATGCALLVVASISTKDVDAGGFIINIAGVILMPFGIVKLREAVFVLNNSPYGSMEIVEMTAIKMSMCSLFMVPVMIIKETIIASPTAWEGMSDDYGTDCVWLMLGVGFILTLINQSMVVALCFFLDPVAKGVVMDFSNIPQLTISFLIGGWTLQICGCTVKNVCKHIDYPYCPC
eukprot:UN24257